MFNSLQLLAREKELRATSEVHCNISVICIPILHHPSFAWFLLKSFIILYFE